MVTVGNRHPREMNRSKYVGNAAPEAGADILRHLQIDCRQFVIGAVDASPVIPSIAAYGHVFQSRAVRCRVAKATPRSPTVVAQQVYVLEEEATPVVDPAAVRT